MTDEQRKALLEIVGDDELQRVFQGTNFGTSAPRDIVADTLLKVAGDFSTGHTAIVCCQELGLLGKNKREPRMTKKGRRYHYYAQKCAALNSPDVRALVEALGKILAVTDSMKKQMDAEDYIKGTAKWPWINANRRIIEGHAKQALAPF